MRFTVLAASIAAVAHVTAYSPSLTLQTDKLAAQGLLNLAIYTKTQEGGVVSSRNRCTLANAAKRKEWFACPRAVALSSHH